MRAAPLGRALKIRNMGKVHRVTLPAPRIDAVPTKVDFIPLLVPRVPLLLPCLPLLLFPPWFTQF